VLNARVIPCLLLLDGGLTKTTKFKAPSYVGDPLNAVRIFNEKEVDELVVLDIGARRARGAPDFDLIAEIASEAFIPLSYGGAISTLAQAQRLIKSGVEKVVLNTVLAQGAQLMAEIGQVFGRQSVVASIDVKKKLFGGYEVAADGGRQLLGRDPLDYAREMERAGAGEILLNAIDRDGTRIGYDCDLIAHVAGGVGIPVVACGGAGRISDFPMAIRAGASAVAAGSLFVYHGPHRAVLLSYPDRSELEAAFA